MFQVPKLAQVAAVSYLHLSVYNCPLRDDPVQTAFLDLPPLLLADLTSVALTLPFLRTFMPELPSPIKCKSLSHWLTHARSTKQQEAIAPLLEEIEMSLNAVPETSQQHNPLFSIPLSSNC